MIRWKLHLEASAGRSTRSSRDDGVTPHEIDCQLGSMGTCAGALAKALKGDSQTEKFLAMFGTPQVQRGFQAEWIDSLAQRTQALGYRTELQERLGARPHPGSFFIVHDRVSPFKTSLIKPLDDAKLLLAEHFRNKYGIHIAVEMGAPMDTAQLRAWVEYHMQKAEGKAFAVLARTEEEGYRFDADNYLWHMTPFILRHSENHLEVLNLDSARRIDPGMVQALKAMAREGLRIDYLELKNKRQADYGSCHTDAILVAKDALIAIGQAPSESLFKPFKMERLDNPDDAPPSLRIFSSELPNHLQKTSQYRRAFGHEDYSPDAAVVSGKRGTIGEHRAHYSRDTQVSGPEGEQSDARHKRINHYLSYKGYHLTERAVQILETWHREGRDIAQGMEALRQLNRPSSHELVKPLSPSLRYGR